MSNKRDSIKPGTSGKGIAGQIAGSSETYTHPDGQKCPAISLEAVKSIAGASGMTSLDIEISALKQGITPWRYLRNTGTIGLDGQLKLLQSSVAVVGAGGLGGTIIELLARQGVGHLIVIDNDRFSEQDLNRQLISAENNMGEYKATVAAMRVREINSALKVTAFVEKLTGDNARRLLKEANVVADGLDNLPSRFVVEKACHTLKIPYVYGSIAGFSGQLMTIFPGDPGLSCIYGSAGSLPERGLEIKVGNPSATPAIIAAWQVQEIVKVITGTGKPMRNCLLVLDTIEGSAEKIDLSR